jgi:hypothetical protein
VTALPFLTAYNPLGGSPGSIDPLGAFKSYFALVDLLLPGMSTITTRSRYLSMICAALANAERFRSFPQGPAGLAARREAIEPFERLWGLACATAQQRGRRAAARDFRGITFAQRYLRRQEERNYVSPDFTMLKSQARTAGVATYWTTIQTGDLATEEGALAPDGQALAKQFPMPPVTERDLEKLASPSKARSVRMPLEDLYEWSDTCHLGAARAQEKKLLASALLAPNRREAICIALRECENHDGSLPENWNVAAMRKLRSRLKADRTAQAADLPVVIDAIVTFEQLHEAVLAVFDNLLWWGTESPHRSIRSLFSNRGFKKACAQVCEQAKALVNFKLTCEHISVCKAIDDFVVFASDLVRAKEADVPGAVLRRHRQVQSGKLDGGVPKREWVTYELGGKVLRPSPRFQRRERPDPARGRILTHHYRVEQFVGMLRETGVLANPPLKGLSNA